MDISQYCSSSITPTNSGLCFVQFPSFCWQCEIALCKHDTTNISYGQDHLFPDFQCDNLDPKVHKVILASRVFWYIWVRIIDTDNMGQEHLFLMIEGRIFTFELIGKVYFSLIYRDMDWEIRFFCDIPQDSFFTWEIIEDTFYIKNTMLDSIVYMKGFSFQYPKILSPERDITQEEYTFYIIEDPISPGISAFLKAIANTWKHIHYQEVSEWIFSVKTKYVWEWERNTFIGFLGKYCTILPVETNWLPWYLLLADAEDSHFHLPKKFESKTGIEYFDPQWHELRIWLLELTLYEYLLRQHIVYLETWIIEIQKLDDERIQFQEIHMNMTLQDAKKIYPQYLIQYRLLLSLLKNIIS